MGTDESFHPLGEAWEAHLEAVLEESDFDAELGMALARDAQRVTKGELSEAVFHDRYHEAVEDEFGVDDRPTEAAWREALAGADVELAGDVDRRAVLAGGAGLFGAGIITAGDDGDEDGAAAENGADAFEEETDGVQWGMTLDLETCDGCLSCVTACSEEHNTSTGAHWMYILAYDDATTDSPEPDEYDDIRDFQYLIRPCQHCEDAPCEKVCPTTARHTRLKDGLVLTDYDICIGCRYCQVACPYGVNYFQWGHPDVPADELDEDHVISEEGRPVDSRPQRGTMGKCTFCPTRQDGLKGDDLVGRTACEDACPPGAIQFGNLNDPDSVVRQYAENPALGRARELLDDVDEDDQEELEEAIDVAAGDLDPDEANLDEEEAQNILEDVAGGEASTFRLLEEIGTNPNIVYIGNEPGPDAEQVDHWIDYEDIGEVDVRKDELDRFTLG